MFVGKRNHLITIERVTVTDTGVGAPTEAWNTVATVWANKNNLNQSRALENGVTDLDGSAIYNIWYNDYPTLDKTCRIIEGGVTYVIHSIVPNEKIDLTVTVKVKN